MPIRHYNHFVRSTFRTSAACESLPTTGPGGENALAELSGIWVWSHAGKPSIQSPDIDPAPVIDENMADSKLSLNPDGSASMIAVGQSQSFEIKNSKGTIAGYYKRQR